MDDTTKNCNILMFAFFWYGIELNSNNFTYGKTYIKMPTFISLSGMQQNNSEFVLTMPLLKQELIKLRSC